MFHLMLQKPNMNLPSKILPGLWLLMLFGTTLASAQKPITVPPASVPPISQEANWRWIGQLPASNLNGDCPDPPSGWVDRPLFNGFNVPDSLRGFCVYEFENHPLFTDLNDCTVGDSCDIDQTDVDHFIHTVGPGLQSLRPDQLVVGLAGGSLEAAIAQAIEPFFFQQIGHTPLDADDLIQPPSRPRLVIVDTKPERSLDRPSNSPHGDTLTAMAQRILCPSSNVCLADIRNELGLSYVVTASLSGPTTLHRDRVNGGMVGTISELAQATFRAVDNWYVNAGSQTDSPLVINLSVAWDGNRFGDIHSSSPDVLAMHKVLQYASCRGVLTVVAAGNRGEGPLPIRSAGPMMPAAWELEAAPAPSACLSSGIYQQIAPTEDVEPTYKPLVYAVAAIDPTGGPSITARDNSQPPRVAFGGPAIVQNENRRVPMTVLTGSSVAALVTSITSAKLWLNSKDLTSHQIMDHLDTTGELPVAGKIERPDFCQGSDGQTSPCYNTLRPSVRRISLCQADQSDNCPVWRNRWPSLEQQAFSSFDGQLNFTYSVRNYVGQSEPLCDTLAHYTPFPIQNFCPEKFEFAIQDTPWVFPQPLAAPCPPCTMRSRFKARRQPVTWAAQAQNGRLRIEVDRAFSNVSLSQPTLTLCPRSSLKRKVYSLAEWNPQAGDKVLIQDLPIDSGCTDATLSFKVDTWEGSGSVVSPILVIP